MNILNTKNMKIRNTKNIENTKKTTNINKNTEKHMTKRRL